MSSTPANGDADKWKTAGEVVLRDLQGLLRKSIGGEVEVLEYKTKNLLPKGENYGSTMLKVDAVIKRNKNSPKEDLPLVAKMIPTTEFQRAHFNPSASFAKEIYVFEKLLPTYREIERDAGVEEKQLIDLLPKFYGGRLTMNEDKPDQADEDAVMVMENIKVKGYYTNNRKQGLNLSDAKLAITELARYHALGMAMKYNRPADFEKAREPMAVFPFHLGDNEFDDVTDHLLEMIDTEPRMAKYAERAKRCINADRGWKSIQSTDAVEPWITITHGDFWINNIMFHKDKNGKLDDVQFVDFQLANISSPTRDLPYFLCGSSSLEVLDNHVDELLDIYYNHFIEVLKKTGCDTTPFTREAFNEQLRKDASGELFHCLMAIKFFTAEASEEMDLNDLKNSVMMASTTTLYLDKCCSVVRTFAEKGWI